MAWSNRSQDPIIFALASDTDVDGSAIPVQMVPRSFWDEDPRFLGTCTVATREEIRMRFGNSSFSSTTEYVCVLRYEEQGKQSMTYTATRTFLANGPVYAVGVVEALAAATRSEDLADAFAWVEDEFQSQHAQDFL